MSLASIGLSGMRAAQMQLNTTAHNVANAQTPGFQRQAVVQTAQANSSGVRTQLTQETQTAPSNGADFNHTAEDVVTQRMSVYNFAANLRSVQAEDRMLGTLLDTRA